MKNHAGQFFSAVVSLIFLGTLFSPSCISTHSEDVRESIARLRNLYFARDYEAGLKEGMGAAPRLSKVTEFQAWLVLNMSKYYREKEALEIAEELYEKHGENQWAWFALAGALNASEGRGEEALEASQKALSLSSDHPDIIWMQAEILMRQDKHDEAITFVDDSLDRVQNQAVLLTVKGSSLYQKSNRGRDQGQFDLALKAWEEARRIDPLNLNAHYLPGYYLHAVRRVEEALPLLEKAVGLAPETTSVHQALWRAIRGSIQKSAEEKRNEIEMDMNSFRQARGDTPGALYAVSSMSSQMKMKEKQKILEDKLLNMFPGSRWTEWVLVNRYRAFSEEYGKDGFEDPEREKMYRQMLRDFLRRPTHHMESLMGDAYRSLFWSIYEDSAVSEDELLEVVKGMVRYEDLNPHTVYAKGAIALAERKAFFREAEEIAWEGIKAGREKVESQQEFYKTEADFQKSKDWMDSIMHDALGWVFFNESRLEEAEKELLKSYEFNPENLDNIHHIGQLYEALGNPDKAETYYVKGIAIQTPGDNPCLEALQTAYKKRTGDPAGFESYLEEIRERDRVDRRREVLASRMEDPQSAVVFSLMTLERDSISLEELKGRVVIVNFWGIWCGWCVIELPEYQELHEKYQDAADVIILTINNDSNPGDVSPWMKDNGYTFAVLLDDGYVSGKAQVTSFPTTWFIDKEGRIAYQKVGWSEKLFEEFSWRIEDLRTR